MNRKLPSYYFEKYSGYLLGLFSGYLSFKYISPDLVLDKDVIFDKSIDIGGIIFGFLLTVLTLLIQTENKTIAALKQGNRFDELIKFNKEVVLCSIFLFSYSFFLLIYGKNLLQLKCQIPKLSVSIFFFISILTANKVYIFLRVFYQIISK